jgi:WD40 repeat protein
MFVSGSGDKTVSLWDIRTNMCVQTFYGHNNAVNSSKFNFRVSEKIVDYFRVTKSYLLIAMELQKFGISEW